MNIYEYLSCQQT